MPITRLQAEKSLTAVIEKFSAYTEDGSNLPVLVESWTDSGDWAICWEEGPFEWALLANHGGVDEELASLGEEFGYTPQPLAPVVWPKGVFGEPYYSFVLALYKD